MLEIKTRGAIGTVDIVFTTETGGAIIPTERRLRDLACFQWKSEKNYFFF